MWRQDVGNSANCQPDLVWLTASKISVSHGNRISGSSHDSGSASKTVSRSAIPAYNQTHGNGCRDTCHITARCVWKSRMAFQNRRLRVRLTPRASRRRQGVPLPASDGIHHGLTQANRAFLRAGNTDDGLGPKSMEPKQYRAVYAGVPLSVDRCSIGTGNSAAPRPEECLPGTSRPRHPTDTGVVATP